jgi:hypothetical protein
MNFQTVFVQFCGGAQNPAPGHHDDKIFFTVVPDIRGPSVWNLLHVTLLAPQILWWLVVDLWKFVHLCICLFFICMKPLYTHM